MKTKCSVCTFMLLLLDRQVSSAFPNNSRKPTNTKLSLNNGDTSQGKVRGNVQQQSMLDNTIRMGGGGVDDSAMDEDYGVSLLQLYTRFVDRKPLLTKSITAAIVTTMANLFSQIIVQNVQSISSLTEIIVSWRRVVVFSLTGFCFIGPYLHVWYGFLDRIFAMPKQSQATRTFLKVFIDQTIGLCIFFPLYFMTMEIVESILLTRGTTIYKKNSFTAMKIF